MSVGEGTRTLHHPIQPLNLLSPDLTQLELDDVAVAVLGGVEGEGELGGGVGGGGEWGSGGLCE